MGVGRTGRGRGLSAAVTGAAACVAGAVVMTPRSAEAGLMMDLRAVAINGQPLTVNGSTPKAVAMGPGSVLTLDLFAVVSNSNGLNDEGVQDVFGCLISTGAARGNLAGGRVA